MSSAGCRGRAGLEPAFARIDQNVALAATGQTTVDDALNPVFEELSGPQPIETLLQIGLQNNPAIAEARMRIAAAAERIPQAASLDDPMLNTIAYPSPVQTAAGRQEFSLAMNQKFPWRGKLSTKAAMAEDELNASRANLAATELKVAQQIRDAYYQLAYLEQAIRITDEDRKQLELIGSVVEQMFRVKRSVTQQDVLQVQVALSQIETSLVNLRQQQTSTQANLAKLLHVSPQTRIQTTGTVSDLELSKSIDELYRLAIENRPELHAQLAQLEKQRHAVQLADLNYLPDVTLGFNWISTDAEGLSPVANGDDSFMLSLGMNLPIYRNRLDAASREAQNNAIAAARGYDRLKDETQMEVADLFAKIQSQRETLRLFRDDIIPKQQLTLNQSIEDYQVSKVDFLQMIDNWRKLLQFHLTEKRLESDLQRSLAALARVLGQFDIEDSIATQASGE